MILRICENIKKLCDKSNYRSSNNRGRNRANQTGYRGENRTGNGTFQDRDNGANRGSAGTDGPDGTGRAAGSRKTDCSPRRGVEESYTKAGWRDSGRNAGGHTP